MPLIAVLILLFGSTIAVAEEDTAVNNVDLNVKPLLCIIDRRTPACEMNFLVTWQSANPSYFCLFGHVDTMPLRCWSNADAGRHEERRVVAKSFQYWLTEDKRDEPRAVVTVEVMTTETTDRRRQRRTRHVWDIL
ncbi:MAG TPA: DUF3019 domain-containing protein [Woeseiaceae bacterium]